MSASEDRQKPAGASKQGSGQKKAYQTPRLATLGSVRDLTLGGVTTPSPDGGQGTRKPSS